MNTNLTGQLEGILMQATAAEVGALRVGDIVKIKACQTMPEVVGESAEIVDMSSQEADGCPAYQVWMKVISGERRGKIYGFRYGEIEVTSKASPRESTKAALVDKLEKMMTALKIGGKVKIKKCDILPEVVGESAEIVDLDTRSLDKYSSYPVWVKMTSGQRKDKIYGFNFEEIEVLPRWQPATEIPVDEQLERIMKSVNSIEDISEIERAISEVKGKILTQPASGFWAGKTPCWEMFRCPESIKNECPAYKHQELPCWQVAGTFSKLQGDSGRGCNTDICHSCRVYKKYGNQEPIVIRFYGNESSGA